VRTTILRSWSRRGTGKSFSVWGLAGRDDQISTLNILGGLLAAITLAGALAITGSLLTAALVAATLFAATSIAALVWSYRVARRHLAESRDVYRLIADNANDLILRHDCDGNITFASPASSTLLGVAPGALLRRGLAAAIQPDDVERCEAAIFECIECRSTVTIDVEIAGAQGGAPARSLELRCKPLPGGDGAVTVMRDITSRKWHALAMRQAREEAESASRAKSAFIATISHELRTPLNAILGFSELLNRELLAKPRDARQLEYCRIIHESGEHLMSLVRDLLDISKIEAGKLTICTEPFAIRDVIKSAIETLHPAANSKSIGVDVSIADELDDMVGDQRALKQMLMNLLSNACKFTPAGGRIELTAAQVGDHVAIAVRDTGIGIPADHVKRLGEPFYQVDSSYARQLEGAGLGLAIVRGLVGLHNGRLEIESQPGEGSCFTLILPLDAEAKSISVPARDKAKAPPVALVA
jgi:cell cycle sensor histidine kinase DivJ